MEKDKGPGNKKPSVDGKNVATSGKGKNKKTAGRRGELDRGESKPTKVRGRRHFGQDSNDGVDDSGATGRQSLSESVKADIMMETSSIVDEKLLRLLEDDLSAIDLGALPNDLSLLSDSSGIGSSHFQPISTPDDSVRTVPAKETSAWGRHHGQQKTGKSTGPAGSVAGASSAGARLRLEAGSGYSKNVLSRSNKSASRLMHRNRKPITATASKNEKAKPELQLEWFWYERTTRERLTVMLLMLLFLLFVSHLIVAIYFIYTGLVYDMDYEECTNSSCIAFAKFLKSRMDTSIDPCDDFYGHVCGSKILPADEQYQLQKAINFRHFAIPFDFTKSAPLGEYMQNAVGKKVQFVLNYYKLCMDRRRREKESLQGFQQVLHRVGLDSADGFKQQGVNALLVKWFQSNLAKQLFAFEFDGEKGETKIFTANCGNVECRFMTKTFAEYYSVISRLLKLAQKELDIKSDEEIKDIANDVICTEVRFQNGRYTQGQGADAYTDNFLSADLEGKCLGNGSWQAYRDKMNGYGGIDGFNWEQLVCEIMKDVLEGKQCDTKYQLVGHADYFTVLKDYLQTSKSYRLGRFLQWMLYREMSADLTVEVFNTFYDGKVDEHRLMDFYCFERLFRAIPGIPTTHYVTVNMDERAFIKADDTSRRLDTGISTILQDVPVPANLGNMSEAEVRTRLVDLFWSDTITLISAVRAKWLKTLAFYTLQEAQNLNSSNSHALGIADLLNFQGKLQRRNFLIQGRIPNFIFRDNEQRSVYAFRTRFDGIQDRSVVPPFGLGELPMFRYGLHTLDLGGYGSILAQERIKYTFNWIMTEEWKEVMEIDDTLKSILDGYRKVILTKMNLSNTELMKWGTNLKRSEYKNVQLIANQLAVEISWRMLQDELDSDGIESDYVKIEGLEKIYTFQQLFFLQYARVRCVNLNQTELEQAMTVPPYTPWKLMVNAALSNTKAFTDTWKCGRKSKMRSSGQMNFLLPS